MNFSLSPIDTGLAISHTQHMNSACIALPAFRLNAGDRVALGDLGICEVFDVALVNTRIELVLITSAGRAYELSFPNNRIFEVVQ